MTQLPVGQLITLQADSREAVQELLASLTQDKQSVHAALTMPEPRTGQPRVIQSYRYDNVQLTPGQSWQPRLLCELTGNVPELGGVLSAVPFQVGDRVHLHEDGKFEIQFAADSFRSTIILSRVH